jgi:hypothetical protein
MVGARAHLPSLRFSGIWTLWGNRVVKWVGLFGEILSGLSTENLGLFGDRCWTLSVTPPIVYPWITNMLT